MAGSTCVEVARRCVLRWRVGVRWGGASMCVEVASRRAWMCRLGICGGGCTTCVEMAIRRALRSAARRALRWLLDVR